MAVKVFTPEFAQAFEAEINSSAVYAKVAKGWKWTVGLVVEAEPNRGQPENLGIRLDLFDGAAREVAMVAPAEAQGCDFVISASYSSWKQVMRKQLDPIRGMLQGKLRLRKGALPTIVLYTKAVQELVECTTRLGAEFPDE